MTTQHIPGPWYATSSDPDYGIAVYTERRHQQICTIQTLGVNGAGMANARLIAAAPDLLTTLTALRLVADRDDSSSSITDEVVRAMSVEAAICYALSLPHGDDPECVHNSTS